MYRDSYVKIDVDAFRNNIREIKREYSDYKYYFGVVKANCYGHGEYLVNALIDEGINYLCVSSLEEALSVRKYNSEIPILCFGYIDPKDFNVVSENNITISIISYDYYNSIKDTTYKIKAHMKINTGMNRLGLKDKTKIKEIVDNLENSNIYLEGIYTHFATSGVQDIYWDKQISNFEELTSLIDLNKIEIVHLYNSMSLVKHNKCKYANGVRLGLIMYGFSYNANIPDNKIKLFNLKKKIKLLGKKVSDTNLNNNLKLNKVMSIYSKVISINTLKKNEVVGYEAKFKASKDTYIATIEIGHADGITMNFEKVKIGGKLYNIVAVCMDYIMVEVDNNVKVGDEVIIIGDELLIAKAASNNNDSVHHLLVSISNRLPRVYVEDNEKKVIKY